MSTGLRTPEMRAARSPEFVSEKKRRMSNASANSGDTGDLFLLPPASQGPKQMADLRDVAARIERLVFKEQNKQFSGNPDAFNEKNVKRLSKLVERLQAIAKARGSPVTSPTRPEEDALLGKSKRRRKDHGLGTLEALRSPRDLRLLAEAQQESAGHKWQWKSPRLACLGVLGLLLPLLAFALDGSGVAHSPLRRMDTDTFRHFVTFNYALACMVVGIGLEIVVGRNLVTWVSADYFPRIHTLWLVAQLLFPVLLWVSFASRSMFALPLAVIGTFKFGLPEITGYIASALFSPDLTELQRVSNLLNGVFTLTHHASVILSVCSIVTGVMIIDRATQSAVLGMLALHVVPLLRYVSDKGYIVLALLLEAWTEWEIMSGLDETPTINCLLAKMFLASHWGYLIAGALVMINDFVYPAEIDELEKPAEGLNTVRFWSRTFTTASSASGMSMFESGTYNSAAPIPEVKWGGKGSLSNVNPTATSIS